MKRSNQVWRVMPIAIAIACERYFEFVISCFNLFFFLNSSLSDHCRSILFEQLIGRDFALCIDGIVCFAGFSAFPQAISFTDSGLPQTQCTIFRTTCV